MRNVKTTNIGTYLYYAVMSHSEKTILRHNYFINIIIIIVKFYIVYYIDIV